MRDCCKCHRPIPEERLAVLPETYVCTKCSTVGRAKGRMIFSHKTSPVIEIVPEETFQLTNKYYVANGARSCVKNFSKHICS